jgi:hypothetical protein
VTSGLDAPGTKVWLREVSMTETRGPPIVSLMNTEIDELQLRG